MNNNYKTSRYNYFFKCGGEDYVYNLFSGALSKLDSGNKEKIENFDSYTGELDDFYTHAIKNGFIISKDVDELQILNYYRSNVICQKNHRSYEILTTTGCNARCFYCFEEGAKLKTMSMETAEAVAKFIISRTEDTEKILIRWFGGEPLLNPKVITYITKTLESELKDKNIKLDFQMTTNGSLITEDNANLFKDVWHISRVQITLDGTKEEYERRKAYVNFTDSFERVINNINLLAEKGVQVGVRLNYDLDNYENILELIDYLGSAIKNKDKVLCYAYPLFETKETKSPDERKIALLLIELNKRIMANGLAHSKRPFNLRFTTTKCYACMRNSFLIDPDGKLGKCSTAISDDELLGDVYTPVRLTDKYLKWCSTDLPSEECRNCKFLPLCQGGCKAGHLGLSTVRHYIYRNCFDEVLTALVQSTM